MCLSLHVTLLECRHKLPINVCCWKLVITTKLLHELNYNLLWLKTRLPCIRTLISTYAGKKCKFKDSVITICSSFIFMEYVNSLVAYCWVIIQHYHTQHLRSHTFARLPKKLIFAVKILYTPLCIYSCIFENVVVVLVVSNVKLGWDDTTATIHKMTSMHPSQLRSECAKPRHNLGYL